MKIKEPFWILLVLFVLIGLAYSPLRKASQNNSSSQNTSSSISNPGQNPFVPQSGNLASSSNKIIGKDIKQAEEDIKTLEENIQKEIEKSKRSPYFGKISMSGITGLGNPDPNREFFNLYNYLKENETLKITGWYLKSEITGYFAFIGKAALLPFPFSKTESDIILQQGDRVYVTKGFSPIGISFRTNKCTGYFEENREFYPGLSLQCPRPIDEELPNFSDVYDRNDECLYQIRRINRCTTVGGEFIRDLPDTVSSFCKTYLTTQINYNTCIARHFSDTDFPGNEYRIYLNKFGPLWRPIHDKITLYDENGLVVDSYNY